MFPRGAEAQDWHSDMQLTGKVVLSAAALLLVTVAYRLYKSRPAPAQRRGGNAQAEAKEEAEGSGQPAAQEASPGALQRGARRRRSSKGSEAPQGCSWENPRGPCVLVTGATSTDRKPQRKGSARVRMEENFIQKVEGVEPRLKGKVYDYYVESTSQAIFQGRLAPRTAALTEVPSPRPPPGSLGTGAASGGQAGDTKGAAERAASPQPGPSPSNRGFSRKESLLQIAENPELQLQPDGFRLPAPPCPDSGALPDSDRSSREPHVHLVAGTNFFHVPLTPASAPQVRLDLGNCYEVLTLAKRHNLESLKEAAYKVMSENYLQVLRSPDIYGCLSGAERELILQRRLQGRQYLVVADVCPKEDSGGLCCYDDEQDVWRPLARLPLEAVSRGCAICNLFNYLFVVSGCQGPGHQPSSRVFCYNPLTGIWSEVCPLNQARPHCRLVALDGHLYAIGGECLNSVERYDPRLDRWDFVPPLPSDTFALAHTATACAKEIFVTGGSLRFLLLRFSAQEQRWWACPTGGSKDRTAEMVAVNGFLYRFDLNRSLGIAVYRCSASTRLWYECATYRTPYPDAFLCTVVDNLIYCVGRRSTLCFLADSVSPRFVPKELQSFPAPQGTLLPTVLTLPTPDLPQTRV
ncbi:PREDICTED: kelch domain-containing protein 7A isoform X2 [Cercocebus atys]|uniref:Kelch domain containing 7A n=1 Tax=Cercocebus atys TaxID=9531 RepID=A0A2K5KQ57_CERAT|nr:PREDICTED: kelch domain-containing protein 7A isoform X2 [Cercocebus atys]